MTFWLLQRRKLRSLYNSWRAQTRYEWARNLAFGAAGLGLLVGLHDGFWRLLKYLNGVPLMGPLLIWKLTAMMMLTTFSMVVISSLLTSLTTLYYSFDLRFLMKAPVPLRTVFLDKSMESVFFASWMIGLVMVPFIAALARLNGYGPGFYGVFFLLTPPFLMLAAALGIALTLVILYCFPSARTRDVIYILSSLSLTLVYGMIRMAQPERLARPDALRAVAEYLSFLSAPTAPALPSWWLTKALTAYAAGKTAVFWRSAAMLLGGAAAVYAGLVWLAGRLYFAGYSGAQEGPQRRLALSIEPLPEARWLGGRGFPGLAALFWKERKCFFRDVKHWSQILLVLGLIFVYLFSIQRLPLDNADVRSLVSFLNIGVAGFVIAALGLRFTFPSVSLEGRSFWILGAAPVSLRSVLWQKFLFSALPMAAVALILGLVTDVLLDADAFTSWLSVTSLLLIALVLAAMGVGFGALFPQFTVENIHQIESSLGGFVYMASALSYVGLMIMILSWPVRMHFAARYGQAGAWQWEIAALSAAGVLVLNVVAGFVPWALGARSLEAYEG